MAQKTRDAIVIKRAVDNRVKRGRSESMACVGFKITVHALDVRNIHWWTQICASSRILFCWSRICAFYFLSFRPIKPSKLEA